MSGFGRWKAVKCSQSDTASKPIWESVFPNSRGKLMSAIRYRAGLTVGGGGGRGVGDEAGANPERALNIEILDCTA
jgi:hypothetical protein